MAARHWTAEQVAKQAAKIRQWQPWARSTGARTPETGLHHRAMPIRADTMPCCVKCLCCCVGSGLDSKSYLDVSALITVRSFGSRLPPGHIFCH